MSGYIFYCIDFIISDTLSTVTAPHLSTATKSSPNITTFIVH